MRTYYTARSAGRYNLFGGHILTLKMHSNIHYFGCLVTKL